MYHQISKIHQHENTIGKNKYGISDMCDRPFISMATRKWGKHWKFGFLIYNANTIEFYMVQQFKICLLPCIEAGSKMKNHGAEDL